MVAITQPALALLCALRLSTKVFVKCSACKYLQGPCCMWISWDTENFSPHVACDREESQKYYDLNLCPFSLHTLKLYALIKWHLAVIRQSWQTSHMRSVEAFSQAPPSFLCWVRTQARSHLFTNQEDLTRTWSGTSNQPTMRNVWFMLPNLQWLYCLL